MKHVRLIILVIFICSASQAASVFKNLSSLRQIYNFDKISKEPVQKKIKIAVLDKGFWGYEQEIGKSLPVQTTYSIGPVRPPENIKVEHGLRMAQIVTELVGSDAIAELQLHNVFGFSNFKTAIQSVIKSNVDLVLYSEVWEFGNNYDGAGFINAEIKKALDAGVTWVNASGNFGKTAFNSNILVGEEDWLILPDQNKSLKILCQENSENKCYLRVVLSWSDFKDEEDIGTNKDLDLALTDDMLGIIQTSRLKQTTNQEIRPGESKYPREVITAEVKPGTYYIRIKQVSKNFTNEDRLRVLVDGEFLLVPSADLNESLQNPADLEGVITVGAMDSERSSVSVDRQKPEYLLLSSIQLADGKEFKGSSNSAAILASALTLKLSRHQNLHPKDALAQITHPIYWNDRGLSLRQLQFLPKENNCFREIYLNNLPQHIQLLMARGAKLVETTQGLRLISSYDPLQLAPSLFRQRADDLVLITPQGLITQYRYAPTQSDQVEVFQLPQESGLCYLPLKSYRILGF